FRWTPEAVRSDPTSWDLQLRTRLFLVDLKSGERRPLFDAPDGALSRSDAPLQVFWSPDSKRIVITHTFLPLTPDLPASELSSRQNGAAFVEVDVDAGRISPILFEPLPTPQGTTQIAAVTADATLDSLTVTLRESGARIHEEHWNRTGGHWRQ